MPMSMSSHTTQKLYVGLPSDRARIRSSSSALSNSTRPLTLSSTTVFPLSGDRKRMVNGMPSGNGTAARSPGRQVPSYIGLRFCLQRRLPLGVQSFSRAYAGIGVPRAQERAEPLLIELHPFGLVERPLVPLQLQPFHAPEDRVDRLRRRPLAVRVLDTENELPAAVPRIQVVEQRRTGAADVQVAGGAGSETCSDFGHGIRFPIAGC